MKRQILFQHFQLICQGYLLVANRLLQSVITGQPLVIHETDDDFYLSGIVHWLLNNVPYSHTTTSVTFNLKPL